MPIILAHGGSAVGYALYAEEGSVVFSVRHSSSEIERVASPAIAGGLFKIHASLSADGKALIFAAIRPECLGPGSRDVDLFVAVRKSDDTWGTPINLGPAINTTLETL